MDSVLALAPEGCMASILQLVGAMCAAGIGTGLVLWFAGGIWSAVMSVFDL